MSDFTRTYIEYALAQMACGMVVYYSALAAHDRRIRFTAPFTKSRLALLAALVIAIPITLFQAGHSYLDQNPFALKAVTLASIATTVSAVCFAFIYARLPEKVGGVVRGAATALSSFAFFVVSASALTSAYYPKNTDFNAYFSYSGSIFKYCLLPTVIDNEEWTANVPDYERRLAHLQDESLVKIIIRHIKGRKKCEPTTGLVMRAEASATGAEIQPVDVDAKLFSNGAMTWAWRIKPLETGTQYVHLRLYISHDLGTDTNRLVPVFGQTLHLNVISGLGELFIPLLPVAVTFLVPLVPVLWQTLVDARRRSGYPRRLGPDGESRLAG